ncbi:MAG: nucleotidyltransferase domain-containing protein [Nanoarchaeota archaeon]
MSNQIQRVVSEQIKKLKPDVEAIKELNKRSKDFIAKLEKEISKAKVNADVFVGGSFAKGTLLKADNYDVDIFVRFDAKYENISDMLDKFLRNLNINSDTNIERVHGSRDYFIVRLRDMPGYFEIIPVMKIRKPTEEKNVTDLTYFHGPYVKKRISKLEDQVRVAKKFLKAQEVYGAETYVKGFSGYTVELLIIKYKSFVKMLKELIKVTSEKRLVIDLAKHYKKINEVFIQLNEAKIHSPVILIDPTYKERNALAALSHDTFAKFQDSARDFLRNPSLKFFENKDISIDSVRKKAESKKLDFVSIHLGTDKQAGDIAGTKLKKFFDLVIREVKNNFILKDIYFKYSGGNTGNGYLIAKPKKEIVRIGPPLHMKKAVMSFKNKHAVTFEKNKHIHARLDIKFNLREFLDSWKSGSRVLMKQMHITEFKVED